ncbi:acyltransferase family protein [Flavobacterium litorale]|uniref:Acyltransferase family protein n=1 Tax=Flavobacterium litorale TaxID=2856519 RepID=A0ABX8VFE8_9FLAO|nr:acyltransferase family protein [Flavobacterium litorale]QYJ69339.1 acyltransferase family protein [Flavobacterium litorale]
MKGSSEGINYPIEFMRVAGVILITFTHIRHDFTEGVTYQILEVLPTYGTLLLSVVSGYLFCMNPQRGNLLKKKIRSLLIPYLIANIVVLLPVLIINALGYNYLNRLQYDYTLITEGLLSLHSPPINPPTYFIRDLFVIFCLLALLRKNYWSLLFIIPLLVFGQLLLRWDIAILFVSGFIIRKYALETQNKWVINAIGLAALAASFYFFNEEVYHKHIIALLLFINIVNLKFKFVLTGGYTYLLHLYHTPVIVFVFPILYALYPQPYFLAITQILLSALCCYILYLIMKRFRLGFIAGNRY